MKLKLLTLGLLAAIFNAPSFAQTNTVTQTSLTAAVAKGQTSLVLASATGITVVPPTVLSIGKDLFYVTAVNGLAITAVGGQAGTANVAHANADMVLAGRPDWFVSYDPSGSCVTASTYVTPLVNYTNGNQWLCSTVTLKWVPGWQNESATPAVTTAVASAAGLITPSGPLFHVTGTAAVTGFTLPIGFFNDSFCIIPDGIFTVTTANNIALISTVVVSKLLCYTYDPAALKFYTVY